GRFMTPLRIALERWHVSTASAHLGSPTGRYLALPATCKGEKRRVTRSCLSGSPRPRSPAVCRSTSPHGVQGAAPQTLGTIHALWAPRRQVVRPRPLAELHAQPTRA